MGLLLNIDTATEQASVGLSEDGQTRMLSKNSEQKEHAAWLHVAIEELMKKTGHQMRELNAIAVTEGPGSYTGLRVGMAAAKGFCYALRIPLITVGSLKLMAFAASLQGLPEHALLCPMIDARRMEVFTAVYTRAMTERIPPTAMILGQDSFQEELLSHQVFFFGTGSGKWQKIVGSANAQFMDIGWDAGLLGILAEEKYRLSRFTDLKNSQPAYIKEFHFYNKN